MGLLDGADLDGITGNPRYVPDGKYKAHVYNVKRQQKKDGSVALIFTYKISEGYATVVGPNGPEQVDQTGKEVDEWKTVTFPEGAEDKQQLEYTGARFISLGIPKDKWNSVTAQELIGTPVLITVKNSGQYTNVSNVELQPLQEGSDPFADVVASSGVSGPGF